MVDLDKVVNLLCGPFALVMVVLFFAYFRHHHQFHRLGLVLIIAGFAAVFFREIGVVEPNTKLVSATPIGIMVLTLIAAVKMVLKSLYAAAPPKPTVADSYNTKSGDGGRNHQKWR